MPAALAAGFALAVGVVTLLTPGIATASNTVCVSNSGTVTCSGYQTYGVVSGRDFDNTSVSTLNVTGLVADITPLQANAGVEVTNASSTAYYNLNVLLAQRRISTSGNGAHGIIITSQGSNGGNGSSCSDPTGITCQSGGTGKTGQVAKPPSIVFQGTIVATATGSAANTSGPVTGIRAIGISGNGGNGGSSTCCNGGRGGTGGAGPAIFLQSSGTQANALQMTGDNSPGIFLLSQAGAGGNGGSSTEFGSGGGGGSGGVGGQVTVQPATWSILTNGFTAPGMSVASIGGNGGKGGSGSWVSGGGSGGTAANGGIVTVNAAGSVQTQGPESYGIIAQSVGGRAGAGGSTTALVAFAATGGSGGAGGTVNITNQAALTTRGEQSTAIVAQSIGGAGGHGGSGFGVFYAQGSAGSLGGGGGQVTVTNSGAIDTYGNDAHGIQAQSIGGTGGDGGSAGGIVALGGGASVTSNGGAVSVLHSGGAIRTGLGPAGKAGPDPTCGTGCSHGIFIQSIGGGGGNGGSAGGWFTVGGKGGGGGNGAPAGLTVDGSAISTALIDSSAIFVQSIGGGGGHGGNGVSVGAGGAVAIGGGGGSGGAGQTASAMIRNGTTLATLGDRSHGMLVQSVGGGGGTGGFAVSVAVSEYAAAGVSVGGTGGPGGSGGSVLLYTCAPDKDCNTKANVISTEGDHATGLTAQSVGGGGGNGGFAIDVAAGGSIGSFAFAMGGNGGIGGNGLDSSVISDAKITTAGLQSHGILAQSIGGGGGNGGFAIAGAVNLEGPGIAVAVGGQGKSGGSANTVGVTTSGGPITTGGPQANAILAQSIGGGGGNGGLSIAGTISGQTGGLGVSVGGNGGNGGSAAKVTVSSGATIVTTGDKAAGLLAQSIGGSGGNGGMSFSGAISGSNAKTLTFSLGGAGATGGSGGAVAVTNTRNITTGNKNDPGNIDDPIDNAHGILAQSVGGGGGSGGFAGALTLGLQGESTTVNVALAVGGTGGSAGTGGAVSVSNNGAPAITTYSSQSHGVFAQSVGGSGGAGGSGFAGTIEALASASSSTYNVSFAVGGKGGSGSTGGTSTIYNTGGVNTWGSNSHGLFASSVGGSGGSGGSATTLALNCKQVNCKSDKKDDPPTGSNYNLQVGIGGNGGGGSHGGDVTLTNYGGVHTRGDGAMALYAYSIGGSGGDGGDASSKSIPLTDRVKFYKNIQIQVGGNGGSSSHGGAVTIVHGNAPITTEGGNSPAVFAQSVGGGGGRGGTGASGFTGKVAVGGGGGAAGDGGNVNVSIAGGSISTLSTSDPSSSDPDLDASFGIFAQSVGGGGGYGGNPEMGDAKLVHIGTGLAFGAAGGSAGNGGTVIVTPSTSITTHADNAIGIFAQSVGGGGGVAGDAGINPTFSTFLGSNGNTGNGGVVNVGYSGTLATAGDGAHGIFAQSAGGKTTGSSSAAPVSVAVTGMVEATGTDADGIQVQSIGMTSSGAAIGAVITVTVNAGSVVQGGRAVDSQTAGVRFLDGGANVLNNSGTITALAGGTGVVHSGVGSLAVTNNGSILTSAASLGTAIRAGDGDDRIRNRGLIDGSVVLGAGRNHFRNEKRGTYRPGRLVELGHGNRLVNDGTLVIGGVDLFGETRRHRLDGDFVQSKSGRTILVLQHLLDHDEPILHVTGTVDMAGRLAADIRNPELFANGSGTLTVIRAEGGITETTERRLKVETSPVADVEVAFAAGEAQLSYTIDFASAPVLAALTANQDEVARALETLRGIDPAASPLMSVAAAEDLPSFAQTVGRLSPEPYAANQIGTLFSALRFAARALDCGVSSGDAATVTETGCGWMGVQGNRFERESTDDDSRYTDDRWGINGGFERRLGSGWSLGGSLGYERPDMASGGFSDTDGHQVQVGVAARLEQGPWLFGAGLTAGWAWLDVDRNTGADGTAEADQDLGFVSGRLRAGHRFISGGLRLEPRVDLAATVIRMDDLSEDGAGAADLDVDSQTETFFTVQPAFEVGYAVAVGDGWRLEPQASIGLTRFLTGNEPNVQARFAATPGAGGIGASSSLDRTYLDLAVGLEIARGERLSLRAGGFAMLGDNTENYGGTLSIGYRF